MRPSLGIRLLALLAVVLAAFEIFLLAWHPRNERWGATNDEIARALPGDTIVPNATSAETRALTIDAPIDRVWPWLAQLGQDRAGFYSYTILEDLVGCRMPDLDRLDASLQRWQPGDQLWMYPKEKMNGVGGAELMVHEPGRALAFATHPIGMERRIGDASWAFVLEPRADGTTRLFVRGRSAVNQGIFARAFDLFVFQPAHFVMERKTMTTLKARAEGYGRTPIGNDVEVACWTALFVAFVASGVFALRGRSLSRALFGVLFAALAFQTLTFVQPGPIPSVLATMVVLAVVPWRAKRWEETPTLLDDVLPRFEFRDVVSLRTHAEPAAIFRALRAVTPKEMRIATALTSIRYLPSRLAGKPLPKTEARPLWDDLGASGNAVIAEDEDREVVIGMLGTLHDVVDQHVVPFDGAGAFVAFDRPNHQKLAMSVRVVETNGARRIVFDHRTHGIDGAARWKFALYWWLMIKWGSALMVWISLRAIRRRAEREEVSGASTRRAPEALHA